VMGAFFYDQEGVHQAWQQDYPFPIMNLNLYPPGKQTNPLRMLSGLLRLYRFMRRNCFDIVETFTHHANLLALPLAWLRRIPVRVASHHGRVANFPPWQDRLHAMVISSAITTCMVAESEQICSVATREENIREDKIIVIHNGIWLLPSQPCLLAEPEFRVNLSAQGKTLVEEKFNRDQMCTQYRNLFENLLERSK